MAFLTLLIELESLQDYLMWWSLWGISNLLIVIWVEWKKSTSATKATLLSICKSLEDINNSLVISDDEPHNVIITKIQEETKQLKIKIDKMYSVHKFNKDFFANMFHDLRTPINHIQGSLFTLLDGGADVKDVRKKYLSSALKNVQSLASTVHDLEFLSRADADTLKLYPTHFDIMDTIRNVVAMSEFSIKTVKCKVSIINNCSGGTRVFADPKKIEHVLSNLVNNAMKYNESASPTLKILLEDDSTQKEVKLSLIDNGKGIEKDEKNQVFQRFYRGEKSRNSAKGGSGLGLSIVKHILEGHKKNIQLETSPKGSNFYFFLDKKKS